MRGDSGFRTGGGLSSDVQVGGTSGFMRGRAFVAGQYYTQMSTSTDTVGALVQSAEYAARFDVGVSTTFDRIGLEVTTAAASTTLRLGIRQNAVTGIPGTLVVDAGTLDSTAPGYTELTISTVLAPGRYWVTVTMQGGTGVSVRCRNGVDPFVGQLTTVTQSYCAHFQTGVPGALPAGFTPTGPTGNAPKILLRAA